MVLARDAYRLLCARLARINVCTVISWRRRQVRGGSRSLHLTQACHPATVHPPTAVSLTPLTAGGPGCRPQIIHKVIIEHARPTLPPEVPASLRLLAEDCWAHEQWRRPSFEQVAQRLADMQANVAILVAQARSANAESASGLIVDF